MKAEELKELVLERFSDGWPVSILDKELGLVEGTSRRIVVAGWKADKEWAEAEKIRRVYRHGGGSWLGE